MEQVDALILAAGAGTRFGDDAKLLAELHGRPVVAHVVEAARAAASVARVVVVVGARGERLRPALAHPSGDGPLAILDCPDWRDGQSASLRCGLAALEGAERVVVLLGDQPGVTAAAIDRIAAESPGTRASYDGRPGHPALLGPEQIEAAQRLRGDEGLRALAWRLVECGDVADGADVDTLEDLQALRGRAGGR
ncbi:MAG TPA: NTP transferase domain-containing protein [Solirubrobacteraceae bacterium]